MRAGLYRSGVPRRRRRAAVVQSRFLGDEARPDRGAAARRPATPTSAIAEGVMGLFDGVATPGAWGNGSTADIAAATGWPVVLVLDVAGPGAIRRRGRARLCDAIRDDVRRRRRDPQQGGERSPRRPGARRVCADRHPGVRRAARDAALTHCRSAISAWCRRRKTPRWRRGSTRWPISSSARSISTRCEAAARPRIALQRATGTGLPPARPAHRAGARRRVLLRLSASPRGLARGRRRDRAVLAARRRGARSELRCRLAAGRLSGTARRQARRGVALHAPGCARSRGPSRCMASAAAT